VLLLEEEKVAEVVVATVLTLKLVPVELVDDRVEVVVNVS
jgi:hypothetical protein